MQLRILQISSQFVLTIDQKWIINCCHLLMLSLILINTHWLVCKNVGSYSMWSFALFVVLFSFQLLVQLLQWVDCWLLILLLCFNKREDLDTCELWIGFCIYGKEMDYYYYFFSNFDHVLVWKIVMPTDWCGNISNCETVKLSTMND